MNKTLQILTSRKALLEKKVRDELESISKLRENLLRPLNPYHVGVVPVGWAISYDPYGWRISKGGYGYEIKLRVELDYKGYDPETHAPIEEVEWHLDAPSHMGMAELDILEPVIPAIRAGIDGVLSEWKRLKLLEHKITSDSFKEINEVNKQIKEELDTTYLPLFLAKLETNGIGGAFSDRHELSHLSKSLEPHHVLKKLTPKSAIFNFSRVDRRNFDSAVSRELRNKLKQGTLDVLLPTTENTNQINK